MEIKECIKKRRSVREFEAQTVPKEVILMLLDMARWAPYACECWRFVVVTDAARKKKLGSATGQMRIARAPIIIVVGADVEGKDKCSKELYVIQDTAAAVQNLMLTAVEEGLGTCWVGAFDDEKVAQSVGFPENIRVMALIPLGYPAGPLEDSSREPLEKIAFWETYPR